jgi:hypothetical protein
MNRRFFQFATILLWLALPLVALQFRQAWDRLPARIVTHFNMANQPNGWMTRDQALNFILIMVGILLSVGTIALLASARRKVEVSHWALLGLFAVLMGFLLEVNRAILDYNLNGTPIHVGRMSAVLAVAVAALTAVIVTSHRHAPLPDGELLAVETTSGRVWGVIIVVAMFGPLTAVSLVTHENLLWPMVLLGSIGLGAMVTAWSGFEYRFGQHGVEIRMLGFRLRSIPRSAILSYSIEPWAFIRGYGIRGLGATRAYVWGNRVVHIKTTNGEVYLGHNDPQRIMRDLDMVTGARAATKV